MTASKGLIRYPIVIELGDRNNAHGVSVPDVPGAFSAGDTIDEAITNAKTAISMMLDDYIERGDALPEPSSIEVLREREEFLNSTWAFVDIDIYKVNAKAPPSIPGKSSAMSS
ncbi:Antitoxin HicB [Dyella sp. AD56]|uniref:type II toxin-antitoxin system HicB family antitoxin n=1 Tax=Dyella sp. AD56 TaxID=1528744 RepID=UPI000C83BF8B|nr:type II toxin-antitoxin system HicB family antitoxin [Dyella sp. AD56]PMQ03718.1 Antitoxin HicB [Dyella sp. AD56]